MRPLDRCARRVYGANTTFVVKWWLYFGPSVGTSAVPPTDAIPSIEEVPPAAEAAALDASKPSLKAIVTYRDFVGTKGVRLVVLAFDEPEGRRFGFFCRAHGIEAHLLPISDALLIPGEAHLNPEGNR